MNLTDDYEYLLGLDLLATDDAENVYLLGASGYTDGPTVLAVQRAILAHPAYADDPKLSLAPYGADGVWGPTTARALERFNGEYAGLVAAQAGPRITDGTLQALGLRRGGGLAVEERRGATLSDVLEDYARTPAPAPAPAPKAKSRVASSPASPPAPFPIPGPAPSPVPGAPAPAPAPASGTSLALKIGAGVLGAVGVGLVIVGVAGAVRARKAAV